MKNARQKFIAEGIKSVKNLDSEKADQLTEAINKLREEGNSEKEQK